MSVKLKGIYLHVKSGNLYHVLKIGRSVHKPRNKVVIYEQLYESFCGKFPYGSVWTRDLYSFTGKVYESNVSHNRFERMKDIEEVWKVKSIQKK